MIRSSIAILLIASIGVQGASFSEPLFGKGEIQVSGYGQVIIGMDEPGEISIEEGAIIVEHMFIGSDGPLLLAKQKVQSFGPYQLEEDLVGTPERGFALEAFHDWEATGFAEISIWGSNSKCQDQSTISSKPICYSWEGPRFSNRVADAKFHFNGQSALVTGVSWKNFDSESMYFDVGESSIFSVVEVLTPSKIVVSGLEIHANAPVNEMATIGNISLKKFSESTQSHPENLVASGTISFENLTFEDNRFNADMKGEVSAARLDNEMVDPSSFGWAAAAAATAATSLIVWKLLGTGVIAGFTRISQEEALEHPKRQVIYDYVLKAPGATFREVVRETGYATGTTRHHLTILKRSKAIMEQKYAQTLRYYENHGKYDDSWDTVALLREPELAELHEWLMANPGMNQKSIIAAFDWSRSTVQHRLNRLVDGGLAVIRPMGRQNLYEALKSVRRN